MNSEFSDVIEKVKKLTKDEKEELRFLLDKYLIEGRREEILENYKKSLKEFRKLEFSSDTDRLKEMLE